MTSNKPYLSESPWTRLLLGWSPERVKALNRNRRLLCAVFLSYGAAVSLFAFEDTSPPVLGHLLFAALLVLGWMIAPALGMRLRRELLQHPLVPEIAFAIGDGSEPLKALRAQGERWTWLAASVAVAMMLPLTISALGAIYRGQPDAWIGMAILGMIGASLLNWIAGFHYRVALFAAPAGLGEVLSIARVVKMFVLATLGWLGRFMGAAMIVMIPAMIMFGEDYINSGQGDQGYIFFWLGLFALWEVRRAQKRVNIARGAWSDAAPGLAMELREVAEGAWEKEPI